jgi:hypothetical protein
MSNSEDKTSGSPRDPIAWQAWAKKRLTLPQTPEQVQDIKEALETLGLSEPPPATKSPVS